MNWPFAIGFVRHYSSFWQVRRRVTFLLCLLLIGGVQNSQLKEIDQSGNCISTNITNPSPFPPPLPSHVSTKNIP